MKLSIVVPVYNVEKYIVRCISSLIRQNFEDYEIIIVNDGSPDRSIEVLNTAISDDKITIINQENGGLSFARNTGMQRAKGEYIWFVDSDDWIEYNCLSGFCNLLDGCDILYFNKYFSDTDNKSLLKSKNNICCTGRELSKKGIMPAPHHYIYRRDYLECNHLTFPVGIVHEDSLFSPIAIYKAKTVKPYNIPVYHKFINQASITHTISPRRCYDLMTVTDSLLRFASYEVKDEDRYEWGNCIADCFNEILMLSLHYDDVVLNDIHNYITIHRDDLEYLCKSRKFPSRVLGYLLKLFRFPPIKTYKILYKLRY